MLESEFCFLQFILLFFFTIHPFSFHHSQLCLRSMNVAQFLRFTQHCVIEEMYPIYRYYNAILEILFSLYILVTQSIVKIYCIKCIYPVAFSDFGILQRQECKF